MPIASYHSTLPEGDAPEWVHLLPAGTFRGRDGRGPYMLADPAGVIAASMAEGDLALDENHSTDFAAPAGAPSPARGWIKELQARPDGIWGRVEWAPSGKQLMGERAYRGISPVFEHDERGRVTRILRAALTNTPNLHLTALHAALTAEERDKLSPDLFAVPAKKELPLRDPEHVRLAWDMVDRTEDLTAAERAEARTRILRRARQLGIDTKNWDTAAKHAAQPGEDMDISKLRAALKLPETADEAAVLAAIEASATAVAAHSQQTGTVRELEGKVVALQTQLSTLQGERATERATAFVDGAIKAGKPIVALREHYIARHVADATAVEKEIEAMVSLHAGGVPRTGGRPAEGGEEPTALELETAQRMSLDPKELAKARRARETGKAA